MQHQTTERRSPGSIVRIDGYELACSLPEVIGNSRVFFDSRRALVVAVTTADGTVGATSTGSTMKCHGWDKPSGAGTDRDPP